MTAGEEARLARYLAVLSADGYRVAASAATLTSGQFHDVVLAGDVAYRFPRDEESRRRLPQRVALLAALVRCRLPVTIPDPLDVAHVDGPVGTCYVAVRRLRGEPPGFDRDAVELPQAGLVTQLAGLLDQLASLGLDPAVLRAVPGASRDHWPRWCDQVRRELFPLMSASGRRRAEAELAAVLTVAATGDALVHGDLGGSNLLLARTDGAVLLTGVLDWDEACVGNQASDLASLAVTFGWEVADGIEAARQPARAESSGRPMIGAARTIAATFALQQALPAALSGDADSLDDGLSGYR
jgi:aminoglycoside phosphotransferase (APT) family kinase protein